MLSGYANGPLKRLQGVPYIEALNLWLSWTDTFRDFHTRWDDSFKENANKQLTKLNYFLLEQYWTSSGDNTPQDTCLPSRKLYKLDEPDTQDTAGEARTNSAVVYSYGPPHMAKQKQDDQLEHT